MSTTTKKRVTTLILGAHVPLRLFVVLGMLLGMLGVMVPAAAAAAFTATLEGQCNPVSACGTPANRWVGNNLSGWAELQYVPVRVSLTGPSTTSQTITVNIDHTKGGTPGIQDLRDFTTSANVTFVANGSPTLTASSGDVWTYSFTIAPTNGNPGFVEFRARLAAGAHNFPGSSLALGGTPALGTLQIHKPGAVSGNPDLGLTKSASSSAAPGATVTYTLDYQNTATGSNPATGVQLADVLPAGLTYVANSCTGTCTFYPNTSASSGGTLIWDLDSIATGAAGSKSYQATVDAANANDATLTNYARILSAENDANPANNSASHTLTVRTTAVSAGQSTVTANPASVTADGTATSTITVTLKDAAGNPVGGKTVSLSQGAGSSTVATASPGSGTTNASGVATFTVTSTKAEAVTYTATNTTDTPNVTVTQTAVVTFTAGALASVIVTPGSATKVAGESQAYTVTGTDQYGNVVPVPNATFSIAPAANGTGSATGASCDAAGNCTAQQPGDYTVTVTSGTVSGTATLTIIGGTASRLVLTGDTAALASGDTRVLTATLQDAAGNTVAGDSTTVVTFDPTAGGGSVTGLGAATASSGVASLTVTGNVAGAVSITATAGGFTSNTLTFTVTAGAPHSLTVDAPATATAGETIAVTVTAKDAAGNTVTGYNGTIALSSTNDGQAVFPPNNGSLTLTGGTGSFSVVLNTAGTSQTITATGTIATVTITGSDTVNVSPAAAAIVLDATSLRQTFTGSPLAVTATTTPAGLSYEVTYTGTDGTTYGPSTTPPTAAGSYTVTATITSPGYSGSTPPATFIIDKAAQSIAFTSIAPATAMPGGTYSVSATGGASGSPVTFSSTTPAVCSVAGSTVTFVAVGTCTIAADQAGNANYNAATQVLQSFGIGRATATITLGNLNHTYTGTAKAATATTSPAGLGGVSISYSQGSPAVAVTSPINAGSYAVTATLDNATYAATPATGTLVIAKAGQTITFPAPGDKPFGDAPFAVGATASSGLPVSFSIVSGPATIAGSTVTLTGAGPVVVRAAQAGNANYNAAPSVDQTIGGGKGGQTISFPAPGDKPFGDAPFAVGATASSGLPVSFAAAGACTVAGDVVTLTSGGSCTLTAAQGGNANYNPAAGVSHTFNVTYRLTLSATAGGSAGASPVGPNYLAGTVATVTATPAAGHIFTGWTIGGAPTGDRCIGWANPFTITMNANYTVVASFVPLPAFPDVSASNPAHDAISQLAARKVILGYQDGRFGPQDNTLRAQMAALIARAMCWDNESHRNAFPDQGSVDPKLWNNVGTLAHYNVARGYPDGTYKPTANVLYAQTISFITRAMVAKGYWIQQPDNRLLYPNVPAGSGHREDIVTYVHYTGAIPGTNPAANWDNWARPSTRAEFAVALWQALNSYWGVDRVP